MSGFPQGSSHGFHIESAHKFRGLAGQKFIYPSTWVLLKSTFPDTNFQETIAYTSTGIRDTWSSQSRTAFKFDPFLRYNALVPVNFGRSGAFMTGHTELFRALGLSAMGGFLRYTGPNHPINFFMKVRIVPIVNDFDASTLTWNGISSLVFGDPIEVLGYSIKFGLTGGITKVRSIQPFYQDPFENTNNYSFTPNNLPGGIAGIKVPVPTPDPESDTFPGFMMDVFMDFTSDDGEPIGTLLTNTAHFGLTVENEDTVFE